MIKEAEKFLEFAKDTREDFHEPDEQGLSFDCCLGNQLDNAFGDHIDQKMIISGEHEVVLFFKREDKPYRFNLVNLLALAKRGAESLVRDTEQGKCRKLS